jgi:hypothetical protein
MIETAGSQCPWYVYLVKTAEGKVEGVYAWGPTAQRLAEELGGTVSKHFVRFAQDTPRSRKQDKRNTAIYEMRKGGATYREIAEEYGLSQARVSQIAQREQLREMRKAGTL